MRRDASDVEPAVTDVRESAFSNDAPRGRAPLTLERQQAAKDRNSGLAG